MKKIIKVLLIILLLLSLSSGTLREETAKASSQPIWPMRGYNAQHTGQCPYDTSKNNGTLKWKYETGYEKTGSQIWSSPAIASDSTIYFGTTDGYLYAVNPDGRLRWRFKTGGSVDASPAIGLDGTIYVGSNDHYFYAINPDGILKWRFGTGSQTFVSAIIAKDGIIYVAANDCIHDNYYLYALRPDKTIKWKYQSDYFICSSPTLAPDGTIYIRTREGTSSYKLDLAVATHRLCAISPNGKLKWEIQTDTNIYSPSEYIPVYFSPSVGKDGTVYVGSFDKYLFAIKPNGKIKWKLILALLADSEIKGHIQSSPVIASNGTIYVGTDFGYLYAINPDGTTKWKVKTGTVYSCLAIGKEGTIYVGTASIQRNLHAMYYGPKPSYYLYAINPDGTTKWEFEVDKPTPPAVSPAIAPNGTIYIGSNDGCLYAIGGSNTSTQNTETSNIKIIVNGEKISPDSEPIIKHGRTLVPIRAVVEALGGTVKWNPVNKEVDIALGNKTVSLWIGKNQAKVGWMLYPIDKNPDVKPIIINDRTMLPLRFVAESLGCSVDWDAATRTITITYGG